MITPSALGSFALIVGLLTLTPGLDTALILRTALLGHRARTWGIVLGIQAGTLVWGVLGALGVTAVLTASHLAYTALRWAGAAYLVWMGGRMVLSTLRRRAAGTDEAATDPVAGSDAAGGFRGGLRRGAVTNLLNPKMGAFYMAVLPQFVPSGGMIEHLAAGTLLAGVHILLAVAWATVLVVFAHTLRDTLRRPSARRVLDRVTGTVITAFGLRLALGD
ncbi:LysE family translocator [Streptomyces sp. NPDC005648]|uniref:LysE family translocator n=1 Tax=Streptomyces sp. NPDC005648 TaxID=3157044 RepID=UPI0033A247AA